MLDAEIGRDDEADADILAVRLFNPLDYVIDTWIAYKNHGILPETGSLNDQDPTIIYDWRVMNARYSYLYRARKRTDDVKFPLPTQADDWTNL